MRKSVGSERGRAAIICEEDDDKDNEDDANNDGVQPDEPINPSTPLLPDHKMQGGSNKGQATATRASVPSTVPTLAKKVCSCLEEDILSLSEDASNGLLPEHTLFSTSEEGNLAHIIRMMRKDCPNLCSDRRQLVFRVLSMLPEDNSD